ncbi:MAG TPA: SH3 domain-containing protein, partial [Herpetosiphonaceae bacterium]|nr:SH3 domain-containing protein [Herpetosiphonaceae bacterium]
TPAPEAEVTEEEPEEEFADLTPSPTAPSEDAATPTVPAAVTATVNQPTANVRPAPNTGNDPIAKVAAGDVVELLGQSGDWYRVRLKDGVEGWIAGSVLGPPSGPVPTVTP